MPDGPGLGVRLDRDKLAQYAELYRELGPYPYDQDPGRARVGAARPERPLGRPGRRTGALCPWLNTIDSPTHVVRDAAEVRLLTARVVEETPVFDMHTHLFPPAFGGLTHWGIDSLVTYHYLVAELMRSADVRPEQYHQMPKSAQADLIWDTLFVRNTPLSEATRGVVAVLSALGLDPAAPDLREARAFFQGVRCRITSAGCSSARGSKRS